MFNVVCLELNHDAFALLSSVYLKNTFFFRLQRYDNILKQDGKTDYMFVTIVLREELLML